MRDVNDHVLRENQTEEGNKPISIMRKWGEGGCRKQIGKRFQIYIHALTHLPLRSISLSIFILCKQGCSHSDLMGGKGKLVMFG